MMPFIWNESWSAALVNHLWQSTIIVAIAWLLALALRTNHACTRYWIWLAASIKFLLPFSLLISAGEWLRSLIPAPPAHSAIATVMEQVTQPFPQVQLFAGADVPIATHHVDLLPVILLALWGCGVLLVACRFLRAWFRVYTARRAASPLNLAADVPVLASPASIEPGIFGIFRPVLLLPEGILDRLTPAQFRAIIAHEMCHVRRRDNLTYAVHMLIEALFWFHPAVWWIGRRLVEERERACDESVVQATNAPEIYAEGILNVCKYYVESPLACTSGVTGADLKNRIARIMSNHAIRRIGLGGRLLLLAASMIAIIAPIALGVVHITRVSAQSAREQGIVGTWQGTLHVPQANRDLRTEIRIAQVEGGAYKTTFYSIDQRGQPIQANTTFENGVLKFSLVGVGASFEGKLSEDAKAITGTWTQGPNSLPLVLARTAAADAWPIPEPIKHMAPEAKPKFDVVTIKPSPPGDAPKKFGFDGHRFRMRGANLNDLIALAYGLHVKQIIGAPAWAGTDLYDIEGVPDVPGVPSQKQTQNLMQNMLADRLHLKFHQEKRELAVYVLAVAGGGPKMAKSTAAPNDPQGFGFTKGAGQGMTLRVHNLTMRDLATWMQGFLMDRPVVDQTGLTDRYDFELKWTPDDSQFTQFKGAGFSAPPPSDSANAPPSLYTAVQEQLGLKLEATRAPDDVMVIDHVERPSPN